MSALVFGDNALWTLDRQRGRVFRIDPTGKGQPEEVYRTGALYGSTTARDPVVMTWDTTGQRLLLIDSGRSLFTIKTGKAPVAITMRGATELKSVAAIASYSNNLYVLDPQGGEIWRYLQAGDGFDSERTGLLGNIDLGDAHGLAIDGDFYVLGGSSVRHFRSAGGASARELQPLLQGIDRPIASGTGIVADPQRQLFYIGDRGGRRLVVSDRDGTYRRQYRASQFIDVRGVALSADGSAVYVLTGDGLFTFTPVP
jgi:sugar lactone lactonase YvrE